MLLPGRSHVLRTLLFVFVAALCLWYLGPSARFSEKSAARSSVPGEGKSKSAVGPNGSPAAPAISVSTNEPSAAADLGRFTFAPLWGREKDPSLAAFSRWATRYTNASPSEKSAMLPLGVT